MSFKINKNISERTNGIKAEDLDFTNNPLYKKHFPSNFVLITTLKNKMKY